MIENDKNFEDELKKQKKSGLEFIIKTVCHSKLDTTHTYAYINHDYGFFIYLGPTELKDRMKLQVMNVKENTTADPFDEYLLDFHIK